jgi:glutathione-regulated potassium-efflux system ancillary protein KefG
MSRRVLVMLAHPVLERSRVNRRLAEVARSVEGVTVHDLYEAYPSLRIKVRHEQALLVEHDVIVFQHPFYWYSVPALLKEWQDLVLEHGWAYGSTGHALDGKWTLNAISTAGPEFAYQPTGPNRFTIRQLLAPWDQSAYRCRMQYLAPFVTHGVLRLETDEDYRPAMTDYRTLLEALRDDRVDLAAAQQAEKLNFPLSAVLRSAEPAP